jgi:hypothetical protein
MRFKLGFTESVHLFDEMANVAKENGEYQPLQIFDYGTSMARFDNSRTRWQT